MTMRRVMVAAINISFALLLALSSAQAQPLKLRLSVESTPGAPTQHILASFRDALQTAFGDQVEIEYFDSGTLGDEIVHMQQVRTGQLDVIPIGSDAVQLDPKWAVFDIPFLFQGAGRGGWRPIGCLLPGAGRSKSAWFWRDRVSQYFQ